MRATNLLLIATSLVVTGCVTVAPPTPEMLSMVSKCHVEVRTAEIEKARHQPKFTDSRDYAIKAMADALNNRDVFASCDDVVVQWEQTQGTVITSANRTIQRGLGLAAIPLGILATAELVKDSGGGGSSGDTWTVNGSRVNSKSGNQSGNASASGTGLGEGNLIDNNGSTQGGFDPRGNQAGQDVNQPSSNSGTNDDDVMPESPVEEIL